jgi:hypothetical protein
MEYHFDRDIEYVTNNRKEKPYSWALREVTPHGGTAGSDLIPWDWTLYFTAESIALRHDVEVSEDVAERYASETVEMVLVPARRWRPVVFFSMFGTDRPVRHFSLTVHKATEDRPARNCRAWGSVSYTSEIDFRNETTDDIIGFDLVLPEEDFELCSQAAINNKGDYSALFSVSGVSGFYANWSPSIKTDHIKVLTQNSQHKVQLPENVREIPRLGSMQESSLNIVRRSVLGPWRPKADSSDDEKPEASFISETLAVDPDRNSQDEIIKQLSRLQTTVRALHLPVWLLLLGLVLTLLFHHR